MENFTCFVKKEGDQYAFLCVELDIASCGSTKDEALEGLKSSIATYLDYMVSEHRDSVIYRPVPMNELKDFLFPESNITEQPLDAVSLEFEHA